MTWRGHEEVAIHGDADRRDLEGSGGGRALAEVTRKHVISRNTQFSRESHNGATVSDPRRLKELEAENALSRGVGAGAVGRGGFETPTGLG